MPLLARGRLGRGWTTARANALAFNVYYDEHLHSQFSHSRLGVPWYRARSSTRVSKSAPDALNALTSRGGSDGSSAPHRKPVRRVYVHHPARWRACRMGSSPCSRCVLPAGSLPRSPPARSFSTPDRGCEFRADLTDRPSSRAQDGHKHMSGLDEAVIKNVEACKQLSKITRTSLGPNGKAHAPIERRSGAQKRTDTRVSRSTFRPNVCRTKNARKRRRPLTAATTLCASVSFP